MGRHQPNHDIQWGETESAPQYDAKKGRRKVERSRAINSRNYEPLIHQQPHSQDLYLTRCYTHSNPEGGKFILSPSPYGRQSNGAVGCPALNCENAMALIPSDYQAHINKYITSSPTNYRVISNNLQFYTGANQEICNEKGYTHENSNMCLDV